MTTKYEHDQERRRDEKEMLRHSILGGDEPECPKCGSTDVEQRRYLFDVTATHYSAPDCTWMECNACGHRSEPE